MDEQKCIFAKALMNYIFQNGEPIETSTEIITILLLSLSYIFNFLLDYITAAKLDRKMLMFSYLARLFFIKKA